MSRYTPWIDDNHTLSLKYEDLYLDATDKVLSSIYEKLIKYHAVKWKKHEYLKLAKQSIDPQKSHTFNSGGKEKWRESFSRESLELFYKVASEGLTKWGYEF